MDSEAGTTRDAIEVEITHHGRRVMLVDTAGIREAQNDVEARGIGLVETLRRSATNRFGFWMQWNLFARPMIGLALWLFQRSIY